MSLATLDLTNELKAFSDEDLAAQLRALQNKITMVAIELNNRDYGVFADLDEDLHSYYRDETYRPAKKYKIRVQKTITTTKSI